MGVALTDMRHPHYPTHIQVENTMAGNFSNDELKQKHMKAIEMRFYWIKGIPK